MVYLKEFHEIIQKIKTAEESQDPKTALADILKSVKDLREVVVGAEDTQYSYQCKVCKIPCTYTLNHLIRDSTYCEDAGSSGIANFEQTGTEKVK